VTESSIAEVSRNMVMSEPALSPARGAYAPGFEAVARCFADQLRRGDELGAGFSAYHQGEQVVDLWGGIADKKSGRAWQQDTRAIVFSVTKGFTAMAMQLLADRGVFEWDGPIADCWPAFAQRGKGKITFRQLFNHTAGLPYIDARLSLSDCVDPARADRVLKALENQKPAWKPGEKQGYHAVCYGLYAREIIERLAQEPLGELLQREVFEPLGSDVRMGTPASFDAKHATLYGPSTAGRAIRIAALALSTRDAAELRIVKSLLRGDPIGRKAFSNPASGRAGALAYDAVEVRRATLAWASATASADGVARAYLPFATAGEHDGKRFVSAAAVAALHARQSWSECDTVLQRSLGWSQGFLKESRQMFCPNPASFGHAGMGGALGWCDPTTQTTIGYVMNQMDWRVRSPRIVALCGAFYDSEALFSRSRGDLAHSRGGRRS
jgi:CubicO group peptidase (beta-lactamase class C family)